MKKIIVLLFILFSPLSFAATFDIYQFKYPIEQARFDYLTQQFRCLVCQNEALADSNAPLAQDLRKQIAQQIQQGATDQEIKQFLTQRYGDFVLFRPPFEKATLLLWLGPFILLSCGVMAIILFVRQQKIKSS